MTVDQRNLCTRCTCAYLCVLEESVHDAQFVVTAQLQQESSLIINVSITMSPNHTLPYCTSASFPTRGLKSPKRIAHLLVLTLRRTQLISSTNFRYSALEFGPYACIKHRDRLNNFNLNMHTLLVGSIHQHSSLAEGLQEYPLKPGQTVLAQRRNRRDSTHRPAQQC